jgi:chloramphenicol 3-O-phosphotransferase
MAEKLGQIVVINGTSGSGKSSTAETFVQRQDGFWLLYGIDHFLAGTMPSKYGHHGSMSEQGIQAVPRDPGDPDGPLKWRFGPKGHAAFATFHDWAAASSRNGVNIVIDHLLMTDPPTLQDIAHRLNSLPALLVTLKPPYEVLEARVAQREMTKKLPTDAGKIIDRLNRLRAWFYEEVYSNETADLTIDTSVHGLDEVADMIATRLNEGPGNAFAEIRKAYPRA